MQYYATQISEHMQQTPDGFLLCLAVPIARTGVQKYLPGEVGGEIEPGPDGLVHVDRPEAEVFRPETMASFEGKPITLGHPSGLVDPSNWQSLAVGVVMNVCRGEGEQDQFLLADLLVTDVRAIRQINEGLREVSCGYESEYTSEGPGQATQHNIVGNHVALVQRGRCGGACAVQDHQIQGEPMPGEKQTKPKPKKVISLDELQKIIEKAVKDAEPEEQTTDAPEPAAQPTEQAAPEAPAGATLEERIERIEAALEQILKADGQGDEEPPAEDEAPAPEQPAPKEGEAGGDPKKVKTGDAKTFVLDQDIISRAEIVSPGITFDGLSTVCDVKRRALNRAYWGDNRALIETFTGGPVQSFKTMDCATLDGAFLGVAEVMRERNNHAGKPVVQKDAAPSITTPDEMNAANQKFWAERQTH